MGGREVQEAETPGDILIIPPTIPSKIVLDESYSPTGLVLCMEGVIRSITPSVGYQSWVGGGWTIVEVELA